MKKPLTEHRWAGLVKQDLIILVVGAFVFGVCFVGLGLFTVVALLVSFFLVSLSTYDLCRLMFRLPAVES